MRWIFLLSPPRVHRSSLHLFTPLHLILRRKPIQYPIFVLPVTKSLPNRDTGTTMSNQLLRFAVWVSSVALLGEAFSPSLGLQRCLPPSAFEVVRSDQSALWAAAGGKKRRRRKQPPVAPPSSPEQKASELAPPVEQIPELDEGEEEEEIDISQIVEVAKFKFDGEILTDSSVPDETVEAPTKSDGTAIPLPDIKQVLRKKEIEEEMARIEEEEESTKVRIKRTDKKAMAKLLEQQPYADADASFFEEEEYGTVSALLGERADPFLGIPTGPLQVGHFIGALVIVLMAFVEYPGFPLTNLPTPLRGALQGGLLTVYSVNAVLAVAAGFKAGERGQSAGLWIAKTFTVGGIAFDQLTQLPTLEQIEQAKARKGKRALKNRRK